MLCKIRGSDIWIVLWPIISSRNRLFNLNTTVLKRDMREELKAYEILGEYSVSDDSSVSFLSFPKRCWQTFTRHTLTTSWMPKMPWGSLKKPNLLSWSLWRYVSHPVCLRVYIFLWDSCMGQTIPACLCHYVSEIKLLGLIHVWHWMMSSFVFFHGLWTLLIWCALHREKPKNVGFSFRSKMADVPIGTLSHELYRLRQSSIPKSGAHTIHSNKILPSVFFSPLQCCVILGG